MIKNYSSLSRKSKKCRSAFLSALILAAGAFSNVNAQTNYSFTAAGATGPVGPTQSQVNTAYLNTNLNGSVTVSGGIQLFTIPQSGNYRITAIGAQGGYNGGYGAYMAGDFNFTAGTVLSVLVGQMGTQASNGSYISGGGGGGSFVVDNNNNPLVIAGGGGGNADGYSGIPVICCTSGMEASTTTNGQPPPGGAQTGGTSGNGGTCSMISWSSAGAGAGFSGDGSVCNALVDAKSFLNGGAGGYCGYQANTGGDGGFGGGGGAYNSGVGQRGGGGGGYSGGGGGEAYNGGNDAAGGGGGSINNGTAQTNSISAMMGNGMVVITRLCNVALNASSNPVCNGTSVSLSTDAVSNITWSENGQTSSSIVVTPSVTTSYSVTGTSTANCSTSAVITITVNPLPNLSATPYPNVLCVGNTGTIVGGGALSYTWSNGGNASTTTVNPVSTTVYTVSGTNGYGCSNAKPVTVTVNTNSLTVTANTTICDGSSIQLTASGANSYLWSNGHSFANNLVTPSGTTLYTVSGVDANNCVLTASVNVNVDPLPNVSASADKLTICKGEPVTLTASGATTYQWSNGDQSAVTTTVLPIDIPYTFEVTGTNNSGCSKTVSLTVNVNRCTGLIEGAATAGVQIYPNPNQGVFTVETGGKTSVVKIHSSLGALVAEYQVNSGKQVIDLNGQANGVYFVTVSFNDQPVYVSRIVKQ